MFGLILVVTTLLVYQPAWNGKPIWDDDIHLTPPQLRSLHGLARIWTDPAAAPQYYPVLYTIFWLEDKLWDGWTLPYHIITILLHAIFALLLVQILRRLNVPGAWLAAAIFAFHPLHVESVAWFSEIKNTLSGVLAAAATLVYLKYDEDRHRASYFLALGLFVVGLMTKTAIVTLPVVLLILFWWKRGRLDWKRDFKPLTPFFAVGLAAGIVTIWVEEKFCVENNETFDFSLLDRVLIASRLFWFYLAKLFWPVDLSIIYPRWTINATVWWQYLFPVATLALFVGLWIVLRKSRGPLAAFLCFGALLFPVLGFFNLSYFMSSPASVRAFAIFRADHFQYLADVPILVLVSAAAGWGWTRMKTNFRPLSSISCLALIALLAGSARTQSEIYRDNETCFRSVLTKNPESATAHSNLGGALLNKGSVDEAIIHLRRAVAIEPDYQFGHYNLGTALLQIGQTNEAVSELRTALKINPNDPKAYYTLGNALSKKGEHDEAAASYERAVTLQPDFPDAQCNLANLLLEKGEIDRALAHYRAALQLEPNNPAAHYNLAVGLVHKGELDPAIDELKAALRIDPGYPDAEPLLRDLLARKEEH